MSGNGRNGIKGVLRNTGFAVLCLMLFSCAGKQVLQPPETVKPFEGPVTVNVLKERLFFQSIGTLSSEVSVRVFRGRKKMGTFQGVFAYMFPDSIKLRVFDPFGLTAMEMLTSGTMIQVFIPQDNLLYEGNIPSLRMPPGSLYSIEETKAGYILYAFRPGGDTLELTGKHSFLRRTLLNTAVSVYRNGRRFISINFDDFSQTVPMSIRMSFFNGFVMEMTLKEPEINEEIPPEYFEPLGHQGRSVLPVQLLYRMGDNGSGR